MNYEEKGLYFVFGFVMCIGNFKNCTLEVIQNKNFKN